jgi:hypothetical protein
VGLKLISDSNFLFGVPGGILLLFAFHIWMDYAWLSVTGLSNNILYIAFYSGFFDREQYIRCTYILT